MKNWKKYSEPICQVTYPPSWNITTVGLKGPTFMLYAPDDEISKGFKNNINFISTALPNIEMTLQQYVQHSEMSINLSLEDSQILESKTAIVNNEAVHQFIYTGSSRGFKLKFYQRLWILNAKAHILTMTCLSHKYDDLSKDFIKIFNNFKHICPKR